MGKGRQDAGIWRTVCWVPLPLPLSICVVVVSLRPPISLSLIFLSGLFLQWPRFDLPHSTIAVAPLTQTPASLLCSSFLVLPSLTLSLSLSIYIYMFLFTTTTTTTTTTISDSVQVGLRLTVWWKSLRISPLVSPMFFLFPMTEEAPLRLFVSSVNSFFFF